MKTKELEAHDTAVWRHVKRLFGVVMCVLIVVTYNQILTSSDSCCILMCLFEKLCYMRWDLIYLPPCPKNTESVKCGLMLNPRLLSSHHRHFRNVDCLRGAQLNKIQCFLITGTRLLNPVLCALNLRAWLNWTSNTLTGHSMLLEQFGRWDYGYRSTATFQTADAVQVSQHTAISANHLQP